MISVQEADIIIASTISNYGTEIIPFEQAIGRVLAEELYCDRDFPPFNRVSMDGIAIRFTSFEAGIRSFAIKGTQAAGDTPIPITEPYECVEIMTGAALPDSADTVIRYEDLIIDQGKATLLLNAVKKGQSIHYRGQDKKQGDVAASAHIRIDPSIVSIAATIGKTALLVQKVPSVIIISTGDELVDVHLTPNTYQIRRSNGYTLKAILQQYGIDAALMHLPDDAAIIKHELNSKLQQYDVLLLIGGVSMGKYDHVPRILEQLAVKKLLHKIQQRPGKPFWFGAQEGGAFVFAFPGNPVSAFLCMYRYFIPWLNASLHLKESTKLFAILNQDIIFTPQLQYFMQVRATIDEKGRLSADPIQGNGSGDLANLIATNAFLELPAERNNFMKGEVFPIWQFKNLV